MNAGAPVDALAAAERYFRAAAADVSLDPHVQRTLGGWQVVHGHQRYRGVPLYPHSLRVRVSPDGDLELAGDGLVDVGELSVVPYLGVEDAVHAAYWHVRSGASPSCPTPHDRQFQGRRYGPRVLSAFPMVSRPTVLSAGPFGAPIQAQLVIFRGSAAPQLAWLASLMDPRVADFTIAIAASRERAGDVLACAVEAASACSGLVYPFDPDESPLTRVAFPRPEIDYPDGVRPSVPFADWVESDRTHGNNVTTLLGNKKTWPRAADLGPAGMEFSAPPGSTDELLINAFFLCSFMHDFFSLIGFDEEHGNFQEENYGGLGKGGDRLIVNVLKTVQGNANMRAQNDGKPAELKLGTWKSKNPPSTGEPTALDAGVVIHEYAHGVSQRLVGGRLKKTALVEPQGLALGEAWSDYFAITILNWYRAPAAAQYVFARYASGLAQGVRPHPYDAFEGKFGQLGTPPYDEQHGAGGIFAAALIKMHEDLVAHLGPTEGHATGWRLVVASLKILAANPTFLEARNALLDCLAELSSPHSAAIEGVIRAAFAQFGMGRNATCPDTTLGGAVADFVP